MADVSQPKKRLKLDDANNCEQEEIRRLKEVVRGLEESLASRNQKLLEMEESKINVEREKATVEKEKDQLKREKAEVAEEKNKVEEIKIKVEDEKIKFEAKMRKLVECPVCLTLPREGPVPCCANGHLVCNPCLGKLRAENKLDCPTCREPFGEGKSLLAFAVAEEVRHECRHQGCTKTTQYDKIVQHEKECKWRLVICPGSGANCETMIPFCKVEHHAQECHDCDGSPDKCPEGGLIFRKGFFEDGGDEAWKTDILNFEGKLFFCRTSKEHSFVTVDVAMKGSLEECEGYLIEAAVLDSNSIKVKPAVKSLFPPRPLKEDNEPGFCLTVPFNLMSKVWKFNAKDGEFDVEIEIRIVKLE